MNKALRWGNRISMVLVFGFSLLMMGCVSLTHDCCSDPNVISAEHTNAADFPCPDRIIKPSNVAYGWPNEIWVYERKSGGNAHLNFGILLLHELNGASPACLNLAVQFASELRCSVYVPTLFGKPGQSNSLTGVGEELFSDDWAGTFLTEHQTPIIVEKLKKLKTTISAQDGIGLWGVVGMCMTGSFPLAFLDNRNVKFAVTAQPAVPAVFSATPFWLTAEGHRALGLSASDLEVAQRSDAPVFYFRFRDDHISPSARMVTINALVGDRFKPTVIDAYGPYIGPMAHNTLTFTRDLHDPKNPVNIEVERLIDDLRKIINRY